MVKQALVDDDDAVPPMVQDIYPAVRASEELGRPDSGCLVRGVR